MPYEKILINYMAQDYILSALMITERFQGRKSHIVQFAVRWLLMLALLNLSYGTIKEFVFKTQKNIILFLFNTPNNWRNSTHSQCSFHFIVKKNITRISFNLEIALHLHH